MKIFQFGDLHLDAITADNTRPAVQEILKAARKEQPDLIVNTGDLAWRRGSLEPWVALELRELHVELSKIAPVIVVAGNHDLATGGNQVGTVFGALKSAERSEHIFLAEKPCVTRWGLVPIACLPYPSVRGKSHEEASAELVEMLRGLAAESRPITPAILIYHGSIAGARTDSEQTMSTEIDLVLNEADIPACFEAVLCGHIHRPQRIGRAFYNGSPAPLSFSEEKSEHGYVSWEGVPLEPTFHALPVAHPLITVDLRNLKDLPFAAIPGDPPLAGAKVRCITVATSEEASSTVALLTEYLKGMGAHSVKVMIEHPGDRHSANAPEVKPEASIGALLDLYAEQHPHINGTLDALKDFAASIEGKLSPEARMRAQSVGYKLLRLEWSNWKSYGEHNSLEMDQLGRLVAIEGDNATGKSNVAELEAFALYGKFIRGRQSLAEAVRIGQDDAFVLAEFEAAGERWQVHRRLKINGKGIGSSVLNLASLRGGAWLERPGADSRETQAFIEQLVGPIEIYLATRFASQGDIDRLLGLTPAEFKDTMQQAFGAEIFDERAKLANPELIDARRALDMHAASLAPWREEAAKLGERTEALASLECSLKERREMAARAEAELGTAADKHREIKSKLDRIEAEQSAWDLGAAALDKTITDAGARLDGLKESISVARAQVERASMASADRLRLPELRRTRDLALTAAERQKAADAEARHAAELLTHAKMKLENVETAWHKETERIQRESSRITEEHWRSSSKLSDRVVQAKERLNQLSEEWETRLAQAKRQAELIGQTPFGEKCAEAACPLIAEAVTARQSIPAFDERRTAELQAAANAIMVADSESVAELSSFHEAHMEITSRLESRSSNCSPERGTLELEFQTAKARHGHALAAWVDGEFPDLDAIDIEISMLEASQADIIAGDSARAQLSMIFEPEAEALTSRLEEANRARASLCQRPAANGLTAALGSAKTDMEKATISLAEFTARVELAIRDQAQAQVRIESSKEAAAKLEASEVQRAQLENALTIRSTYMTAMGRDGLPYLMLMRALPALERHANHFLCDDIGSGLQIEIEGLKSTQAGDERLEVVIRYRNDFGLHSLAAASGFERVAIGYALRAALALTQAQAHGLQISHWIADEGWGVFDDTNLLTVGQPMLRRLAEKFGRVIVISHQAPIREVCDTHLLVEADAVNGSSIRRTA